MKKLYKPISVLLALAMLFAVFTSAPIHVSAAGYSLQILPCEGGSIVRESYQLDDWSITTYPAGTMIILSANPDEGNELANWDVHIQDGEQIEVNRGAGRFYYFDIPAGNEDGGTILIGATFVPAVHIEKHTVTIQPNYEGGTNNKVKLEDGTSSGEFRSGEAVYINIEWEQGTRFRRSEGDDPIQYKLHARYKNGESQDVDLELDPDIMQNDHADEYYFIMPDADVSVTCEFEYANHEITYEYVPDAGVDASKCGKPYFMIDGQRYEAPPVVTAVTGKR